MIGGAFVRALEDDWRVSIDAVARAQGFPTSHDVARVAERVSRLSAAYNDPTARGLAHLGKAELSARLLFSFPRDVPKGAAIVAELLQTGLLRPHKPSSPLQVLDLGAGLGATSWGVFRALQAAGQASSMVARWVDVDAEALALGRALRTRRLQEGHGAFEVEASAGSVATALAMAGGPYDLVVLGQVLSEMDHDVPRDGRVAHHGAILGRILDRLVAPGGALVVLEPALRDRARHLQALRDTLLTDPSVTVFAPCLHRRGCPLATQPTDWCHEDWAIDLPPWLVPIARGAGLRYQGLTFSYLVLRRDGRTLGSYLSPTEGLRVRVVSGLLRTKGRTERLFCPEREMVPGPPVPLRVDRLDRDAPKGKNDPWLSAQRGDILAFEPDPKDGWRRVGKGDGVRGCEVVSQEGTAEGTPQVVGGESRPRS